VVGQFGILTPNYPGWSFQKSWVVFQKSWVVVSKILGGVSKILGGETMLKL